MNYFATHPHHSPLLALYVAFILGVGVAYSQPTSNIASKNINEDTDAVFAVADFPYTAGANGAMTKIEIAVNPTLGTLYLDNNANDNIDAGEAMGTPPTDVLVADIPKLKFRPVANANGTPYTTFAFRVCDAVECSILSYAMTINVAPVNDPPSSANKTISLNEDDTYTFATADFAFNDPDAGDVLTKIQITQLNTVGTLFLDANTNNNIDAGETITLNQEIITANITKLKFRPAANANGIGYASFQFKVHDGTVYSLAANTITLDVAAVNDPPTSANNSVNGTQNTDYVFTVANFPFTDVEDAALSKVKIKTLTLKGTLYFDANSNGVVNGTEAAVVDDVFTNAQITSGRLKYKPLTNESGTNYTSFAFRVLDAQDAESSTHTMTINIAAVNSAPSSANKTVTLDEDGLYTCAVSDFAFTDIDAGDALAKIQITQLPTKGTLFLDNNSNNTPDTGEAISLNQEIVVADITKLKYRPVVNENGTAYASFKFRVQDNGNTPPAPLYSVTAYDFTFNVTPVNDAPVLGAAAAGALSYNEGSGYQIISPTGLNITDIDSPTLFEITIQITSNYQNGQDELYYENITNDGVANATFNTTTGRLTLECNLATSTPAILTNTLRNVKYRNTSANPITTTRTVSFRVNDGGSVNNLSNIVTRDINISSENDPPSIAAPTPASNDAANGYLEGSGFRIISSAGLTITDPDNTTLIGATVQITSNYFMGEDELSTQGALPGNISASFNPSNGTLTLSGAASLTNYTQALRQVSYRNTSSDPHPQTRTVSIVANDGQATNNLSTPRTINIAITIINNAPTANAQTQTILEDTGITLTLTGNDGEANVTQTLSYQIATLPARGKLYTNAAKTTQITTTPYSLSGNTVYYETLTNDNRTETFAFRVQDNGGTANGGIDTSPNALITINITPVNDAPIFALAAGTANPQAPITKNSNTPQKTITLTGINAGGDNEIGQILTFNITSSTPAVVQILNAPGVVSNSTVNFDYKVIGTVTAPTNVNIRIRLKDDGGIANGGVDTTILNLVVPVQPLPQAPTNFTAAGATPTKINLFWNNAPANQGYEIRRRTQGSPTDELIASPNFPPPPASNTPQDRDFFEDVNVNTEQVYFYKICTLGMGDIGFSDFTDSLRATTQLRNPSNLSLQVLSSTQIFVAWVNNSSLATGFEIEWDTTTNFNSFRKGAQTLPANALQYTIAALAPEMQYFVRVRVINTQLQAANPAIVYRSDYSPIANAYTLIATPTNFTATAFNIGINLSWQSNSKVVEQFVIERSLTADNFDPTATGYLRFENDRVGGTVSYNLFDDNIQLETRYYYRLRATSTNTNSGFTPQISAFTFLRRPTALEVNPVTTTRNSLVWQNNSNVAIGYEIQRSLSPDVGFVQIKLVTGQTNTSYIDTDVLPNTLYYYRVRAIGQEANSDFSDVAIISIFPPSDLNATTISANAINLTWVNNAGKFTGTIIQRSTLSPNEGFSVVATVDSSITNYLDEGLLTDKQYYYRLTAYRLNPSDTSAFSNVAGAITADVPAIPTQLTATASSANQINLQWRDNSNNETLFRIERASVLDNNDVFDEIAVIGGTGAGVGLLSYSDKNLSPNQVYRYRVRAGNLKGNSGYSSIATANTQPLAGVFPPFPPTGLIAEEVSDDQINLRWTNNDESVRSFVLERTTSATGTFSFVAEIPAARTRYADAGLLLVPSPGNAYFYRLRAKNEGGISLPSDIVSAIAQCNLIASISSEATGSICVGKAATLLLNTNAVRASYQWRRNGNSIPGATQPTFNAAEEGNYVCQVRAGSCILFTNQISLVVRDGFEVRLTRNAAGALVASVPDGSAYAWYRNQQIIAGVNQSTYLPVEQGVYYVIVTKGGCSSTSNIVLVETITADTPTLDAYFTLSPNPASEWLDIALNVPKLGGYTLTILNQLGQSVVSTSGDKAETLLTHRIDVRQLPAGVYWVEMRLGKERAGKRLVKH